MSSQDPNMAFSDFWLLSSQNSQYYVDMQLDFSWEIVHETLC